MAKKDNKKILLIAAGIAVIIIILLISVGKIRTGTGAVVNFGVLPNSVACTENSECSGGQCNSDVQGKKFCSSYANECASQSCLSNSQSCSFDYLQFKYVIRNAPGGGMLCKLSTNGKQPYFYNGDYNVNLMDGADCAQIGQSVSGCSISPCYCNKNRLGYGSLSTVQNLYDPLSCVNSNTRSVWFYNTFHSSSSQGGCPSGASCSGNTCKMNDGSLCNYAESCLGGYCWDNACHSAPKPTGCDYSNPACTSAQYCLNNVCYAKKAISGVCSGDTQCTSGICNFNGGTGYCSATRSSCTPGMCYSGNQQCIWNSANYYASPGTTCTASQDCTNNVCVLKSGCAYNNPSCGANYNCVSNTCVLKSGCAYNNPSCGANYNCVSNNCVLKSGCAYNNPSCGANYNCVSNTCVLKSGCAYNNPSCPSGQTCTNNICTVNLKPDGQSCTQNSQCLNSYCFQGICRKDSDGDKNPDYFDSCPNSAANNCLINVTVLPYNVISFSFIPQIQNIGNTISNLQITSITFNGVGVSFTPEVKQTNPSNVATFSAAIVTGLGSLPLLPATSKVNHTLIITGKTTSIYYASDTKSAQQTYYFVKG